MTVQIGQRRTAVYEPMKRNYLDITSVMADLRSQRHDICQAILALEHLTISQPSHRGRPRTSHFAKATSIKDKAHLATAAVSASEAEEAFDAHWHEERK